MTAACMDARRAVLLGEPDRVADHLDACADCRRAAQAQREMSERVHVLAPRVEAPASLRLSISRAIEAERDATSRMSRRRRRVTLVACALLGITVSVVAVVRWQRGTLEARLTVEALAADHMEFASRADRSEFTSSSAGDVGRWLRAQLQFPVVVPELPGAVVLGGRRCKVRGRPAAVVFYRLASPAPEAADIATLFVFEGAGERWSHLDEISRSIHACRTHERGLAVIAREERGLARALVTEAPDARLRELVGAL